MELNEYQQKAMRTDNDDYSAVRERMNDEVLSLLNGAMGLCGEAGEIIDHLKKVIFQGHELEKEYLYKECGDQLWYIAKLAKGLKTELQSIAEGNVIKLLKRYPEGFDTNKSINREE